MGDQLVVRVPNPVFRDWLTKHYVGILNEALAELRLPGKGVQFVTDGRPETEVPPSASTPEPLVEPETTVPAPITGSSGLNPRYTFETFIVGPSNQFAHAACEPWPRPRRGPTTRSSSMAASAWARPT
jgi:chromosomal replication initiator protein